MMYELVSAAGKNPLVPQIFDRRYVRAKGTMPCANVPQFMQKDTMHAMSFRTLSRSFHCSCICSVLRKLLLSQIETHKDVPSISGVALESLHNSLSKEETELVRVFVVLCQPLQLLHSCTLEMLCTLTQNRMFFQIASMIKTHSFVEDAPPAGLPEGFEGFLSWPTLACAFSVLVRLSFQAYACVCDD
jgi:hypothetical protein